MVNNQAYSPYLTQTEDRLITVMLAMMVAFALLPSGLQWSDYAESASLAQEGSLGVKLQWGSIFAIAFYLALRHRGLFKIQLLAANPFIIALVVYTAITTLWSAYPSITVKKVIQFAGIVTAAIVFQMPGRSAAHFIKTTLFVLTGIEIASVIAVVLFPSQGMDVTFTNAWRGILAQKNDMGYVGALSAILWIGLRVIEPPKLATFLAGFGLSVLCVIRSTSSTGATVALIGIMTFMILYRQHVRSVNWLQRILLVLAIAILIAVQIFFIHESRLPAWGEIMGPFARLFGKSADLTGRTDIWIYVIIEIEKHWLQGAGYGAFWLGPGSPSQPILDQLPWIPFQSHNGYLDIINELGAIGFSLFVGLLLTHLVQLYRLGRYDQPLAAFNTALLAIICITNMSESSLMRGVNYPHILLMFSSVCVSSALRRYRLGILKSPSAQVAQTRVRVPAPVALSGSSA